MRTKLILAALILILLVAGSFWYSGDRIKLTDRDSLLIGDFSNSTGDPVFDGSLREALSIGLAQSPLLNLISAEKMDETLRSQGISANTPITREFAPKLCSQLGATAFLTGAIAKDGSTYALKLSTFQCGDSKGIASVKNEAKGRENVVHALGDAATQLRSELGEPAVSLKRFNLPLDRASSSSVEALQSFAQGRR